MILGVNVVDFFVRKVRIALLTAVVYAALC